MTCLIDRLIYLSIYRQFVSYSCSDDFSIEAALLEGLRGVLYCGLSLRPLCYERAGDRGGEWRRKEVS